MKYFTVLVLEDHNDPSVQRWLGQCPTKTVLHCSPNVHIDAGMIYKITLHSSHSVEENLKIDDSSYYSIMVVRVDDEWKRDFLRHPGCEKVVTQLWLPDLADRFVMKQRFGGLDIYHRYQTHELLYLDLLSHVLHHGELRSDRTGVGTLSVFGPQIEFDLQKGFPLLTTKRLTFSHILHEVLWYLSGDTDITYLNEHHVHVWDANTTREFLDQRGLVDYPEGTTGPLYGFQWRHFGGDFRNVKQSPGVDQLSRILSILRTDPCSRRMFMSAWNPIDLDKMCLEPCHVSFQLYVREGTFLDGKLYMRSNDLFLGAPWNIAAYALLIHMFAHLSGYTPGKLVYSLGDVHIYQNHIEGVKQQLSRSVRPFPRLSIVDETKSIRDWSDFQSEHFQLHTYHPHPSIRAQMAV